MSAAGQNLLIGRAGRIQRAKPGLKRRVVLSGRRKSRARQGTQWQKTWKDSGVVTHRKQSKVGRHQAKGKRDK